MIKDEPKNAIKGHTYVKINSEWREGVIDALEGLTKTQIEDEIEKLVGGHPAVISGVVYDVEPLFISVDTNEERVFLHNWSMPDELRSLAMRLHKGDYIEAHAVVSKDPLGFKIPLFESTLFLKRVAKKDK
ncbi:MAG: hypothetical protein HLUCCO18_11450 [Rhodobacteraceae bacterium HLUCCO18]|nr:MAG: hypothetical protein HLUCCO18_11450 [Rhodobacteraceae bacterium HLUCCO18]